MTETPTSELRLLAARIASSYAQANTVVVDDLPGVIRLAYQGLNRCAALPAEPAPEVRKRRRRGRPAA